MSYRIKYDAAQVAAIMRQMQREIFAFINQCPDVVCLVLTNGGIFFASKILFDCPVPLDIRFVKVSSYHGKTQGDLFVDQDALGEVSGKTVLVLDDICDSGHTVNTINALLRSKGAVQIHYVTLIKRAKAVLDDSVNLMYGILDASTDFFVGCGLDDNGSARNLPYIGVVE